MNAPTFGHNELSVRLGILADDARRGLERASNGEGEAVAGWIAYGAALNEGRALFPSDEQFGQWVAESGVSQLATHEITRDERAAAMWAAANPEQFDEARALGGARTVRGIHAKWKDLEAEREAEAKRKEAEAKRKEADARAKAEADARRKEDEAKAAAQAAEDEEARKAAEEKAEAATSDRQAAEQATEDAKAEAEEAEKAAGEAAKKVRGTTGTGDNEWFTPHEYVERARSVLGWFDVDPASNDTAQETIGAAQFFDVDSDGLAQEWNGRVWLNPPYARGLIDKFVAKLREEISSGRCTSAIALTHNYTDTKWFQGTAEMANAICFTRGRVKFYQPDGTIAAPTQGQAFFYFGGDVELFRKHFEDVGFVVEVMQ